MASMRTADGAVDVCKLDLVTQQLICHNQK